MKRSGFPQRIGSSGKLRYIGRYIGLLPRNPLRSFRAKTAAILENILIGMGKQ
ncbi:MAG: hypothetical protein AB7I68_14355 [Porticoccaceae bacterium]